MKNSPEIRETGPVFISYTHRDGKQVVDFLETYLRAGGIVPWRDQKDLPDGNITSTIGDAMEKGLSGGILVVTEEVQHSDFIPEQEAPKLVEAHSRDRERFSLQVLNTIRGESGGIDVEAPDRMIWQRVTPNLRDQHGKENYFSDCKQYALLHREEGREPVCELPRLLEDLLKRRLNWVRQQPGSDEVHIGVQTRPGVNAADAAAAIQQHNHLTIRLTTDQGECVPNELSYRCLQQTLPLLIDAIYDAQLPHVRFSGGCHPSLAWALGAALPEARPRLRRFVWQDTRAGAEWSSDSAQQTPTSWIECQRLNPNNEHPMSPLLVLKPGDPLPDTSPGDLVPVEVDNVVVLLTAGDYHPKPLLDLAAQLSHSQVLVIKATNPSGWIPPAEGQSLANLIGQVLRGLARNAKLHLALSAPVGLVSLVARQCNTLSIDVYERDHDPKVDVDRYLPMYRSISGNSYPVAVVFPRREDPGIITKLTNLTPHDVSLYGGEETERDPGDRLLATWPRPQDKNNWLRREESLQPVSALSADGVEIPRVEVQQGGLSRELPSVPGQGYIVPRISAEHARRADFFFPHKEVRDKAGRIIGCLQLGSFPSPSAAVRPYLDFLDLDGTA